MLVTLGIQSIYYGRDSILTKGNILLNFKANKESNVISFFNLFRFHRVLVITNKIESDYAAVKGAKDIPAYSLYLFLFNQLIRWICSGNRLGNRSWRKL